MRVTGSGRGKRHDVEVISEQESRIDRLTPLLIRGILITIALILAVLVYGLAIGVINPASPKTYEGFTLVRAQTMVKEDPKNGQYWADYIDVMVVQGKFGKAEDVLKEARKAVGDDKTILLVNNAELRLLLGQKKYEEVVKRADVFLKQDADLRVEEMKGYAEKGVTVSDSFNKKRVAVTIDTLGLKATAEVALKKYDDAAKSLRAAQELDPYAADISIFYGNVLVLKGDTESLETARKAFEWALKFLPDSKPAQDGLAEVQKKLAESPSTP